MDQDYRKMNLKNCHSLDFPKDNPNSKEKQRFQINTNRTDFLTSRFARADFFVALAASIDVIELFRLPNV